MKGCSKAVVSVKGPASHFGDESLRGVGGFSELNLEGCSSSSDIGKLAFDARLYDGNGSLLSGDSRLGHHYFALDGRLEVFYAVRLTSSGSVEYAFGYDGPFEARTSADGAYTVVYLPSRLLDQMAVFIKPDLDHRLLPVGVGGSGSGTLSDPRQIEYKGYSTSFSYTLVQ